MKNMCLNITDSQAAEIAKIWPSLRALAVFSAECLPTIRREILGRVLGRMTKFDKTFFIDAFEKPLINPVWDDYLTELEFNARGWSQSNKSVFMALSVSERCFLYDWCRQFYNFGYSKAEYIERGV